MTEFLASPPSPAALGAPTALKLEFRGSAREYFRVWAVNLCLTIVTAGVFSAWAKVRKKRYFYSHTVLDGTPFQYLGEPIPILKGRVVAAALFLTYYASSHFFTETLPFVLAAGTVLAPWVVVRSASFNARYSAYRNMTFRFDSDYRDALKAIYWLGLIPAMVTGTIFDWWDSSYAPLAVFGAFGLLFPWWLRRVKHYVVANTAFGGESGRFSATGGQFFRVYFVAGLLLAAAGAMTAFLAGKLFSHLKAAEYNFVLVSLPIYLAYVLAYAYVQANSANLVWNQTALGPLRFESTLRTRGLALLYITNALGIVASLGLLTPWAVIRTLRYRAENLRVWLDGSLREFRGGAQDSVAAAGAEVGEFFDVDLSL